MKNLIKLITYQLISLLWAYRKLRFSKKNNKEIKNILIVEIALLGDVVSISSLINVLKKNYKNASINVLIKRPFMPLLACDLSIDKIFCLNGKGIKNIIRCISEENFNDPDIVVSASPGINNSLTALLIGKKEITGYLRNFSFKTYYYQDHYVESIRGKGKWKYGKDEHITYRALRSVEPLGINPLDIKPTQSKLYLSEKVESDYLGRLVQSGHLNKKKINVVVHPAASQEHRQWPIDNFIKLFELLNKKYGANTIQFTLVGVESERNLHTEIINKSSSSVYSLIENDLFYTMTMLKNCNLFIGSDSGPKHIADAFSTPIVELLGPMKPEAVKAIGNKSVTIYKDVGCNPCAQQGCEHNGKCVKAITIEDIYKASINLLEK